MNHKQSLSLGTFIAVLLCSLTLASEEDRVSLIALYNATDGDNWSNNGNWKAAPARSDGFNEDPCTTPLWWGVNCSQGRVQALSLPYEGLRGVIPPELGGLSELVSLNLSYNHLTGPIPPELGNLANLEELDLNGNQLKGSIPAVLGNLGNLGYLSLADNQLTGTVPPDLGRLTGLFALVLSSNRLTGNIPHELGNLGSLEFLGLNNNELSGLIPTELGNLGELLYLHLDNNQLTGPVAGELGNLVNLRQLYLRNNRLTGTIPPSLSQPQDLFELQLSGNYLEGEVPAEIASLAQDRLDIRHNRLESVEAGMDAELNRAQRGEALWDSLQNVSAVYPQLAIGGGFEVVLMISNRSTLPWNGRVYLNGGTWPEERPWELDRVDMTGESSFPVTLQALSTRKIKLSSASEVGLDGWLVLRAEADSRPEDVATAFFYNLSGDSGLLDSTGVGPSAFGNEVFFPVERGAQSGAVLTGVALRSVVDRVSLTLLDEQGFQVGGKGVSEDGAELVGELFAGLPEDFIGSIRAYSDWPFFVTVLRVEVTESSGVQLTSVPATPTP